MRRVSILVLALVAVAVLPDAAQACAVCFDASDENREAFLMTTAFLSLFPLGMVGGAGLWLRRRVRERDAQDDSPDSSSS
jgi:uncharacterized membrane protein YciS (DUF1049 family)